MFARYLTIGTLIAAVTSLSMVSQAAEHVEKRPSCVLGNHVVTSVTAYKVEEQQLKSKVQRLRGAEVVIRAEQGLTAEWLRLNVASHLAEMHEGMGMRDCAFDIADVRVEVDSAGAGFRVRLIAPDSASGAEVLRRARLLTT